MATDRVLPETYGARGDGRTDDQRALVAAADYASHTGLPIVLRDGATYAHSDVWELNGVTVTSLTRTSKLLATNTSSINPKHAVKLTGKGPRLLGVTLQSTWAGGRQDNAESSAVQVDGAEDFRVEDCAVLNAASVGIFSRSASQNGFIMRNVVKNTLADGIHTTDASSNITIGFNDVSNTGDDQISVVSYASYGPVANGIQIIGNRCSNSTARGICVAGGENVEVASNLVKRSRMSGLLILSEMSGGGTLASTDVRMHHNTVLDCATDDGWRAIQVQGRTGQIIVRPSVCDNLVKFTPWAAAEAAAKGGPVYGAALVVWDNVADARVERNSILNSPERGLWFNCDGLSCFGNLVLSPRLPGIHVESSAKGVLRISENEVRGYVDIGIAVGQLSLGTQAGQCKGLIIDRNLLVTNAAGANPIVDQAPTSTRNTVTNNILNGEII